MSRTAVAAVCPVAGCGTLTIGGRCDRHAYEQDRARTERRSDRTDRRIYGTAAWRRVRLFVLDRDFWTCQLCGDEAWIVDHDPPLRHILERGGNPYDPDHLRSLCPSCSGRVDGSRSAE